MHTGKDKGIGKAGLDQSEHSPHGRRRAGAFTIVEVMVAVLVLGTVGAAFCGALSHGFGVLQATREDLRATQVMMQKLESIRLCTWSELLPHSFTAPYNPLSTTNAGAFYSGTVSIGPATNLVNSPSYRANMRLVTVNLKWTSYNRGSRLVHTRQMQSEVARYGMQNYIWGAIK